MTWRGTGAADWRDLHQALSPDLVQLDRDLSEIVIEERSSFAAELRAELATEHARMPSRAAAHSGRARTARLAAAVVVLLATCALLVPAARASLGRLLPAGEQVDSGTEAGSAAADPLDGRTAPVAHPEGDSPPEAESRGDLPKPPSEPEVAGAPYVPTPPTLPDVLDREQARRDVAEEYPVALQEAGIGGVARIVLWVRPDGIPETPKISRSSGVYGLDQAALRAARSIRFLPATRSGEPVGTWVEFSIRFVPKATGPQPDPEYRAFEIPPIN